jgi:hypothetical protein
MCNVEFLHIFLWMDFQEFCFGILLQLVFSKFLFQFLVASEIHVLNLKLQLATLIYSYINSIVNVLKSLFVCDYVISI